ncbi:hypothetical protein Lser_V15G40599 [Lactuca serriola]
MSSHDDNGIPYFCGNGFPLPSEYDISLSDQGENVFASSRNGGSGHHASLTLPPPPLVTLPTSCYPRVERYETTQALLACRHQDGKFVCGHVLEMKSHIDTLDTMGVVFPREKAIELVLLSLPKSYSQFIENFYMRNLDVTLIDLTRMLTVAEAKMLKSINEEKVLEGFDSKVSMDIDNGNNGGLEKISLPNGKGSAKLKLFDRIVKRNAISEIVPRANPKESICFYYQLKKHWL